VSLCRLAQTLCRPSHQLAPVSGCVCRGGGGSDICAARATATKSLLPCEKDVDPTRPSYSRMQDGPARSRG
jgi:hypothetical protein